MTTTKIWKKAILLVAALGALAVTPACSSSNDDGGGAPAATYPRQVSVEYRVTSSSGLASADVLYTNDTGGMASVDKAPLPFSQKLQRNVKQFDTLSVSITAMQAGAVTMEILVDNQVVETKTATGTSVISDTAVYVFQ